MELIKILNKKGITLQVAYQRQGNDKNGNPIYIVNVFKNNGTYNFNVNYLSNRKKDKYNNIKIQSYNIDRDVQHICDYMDFSEFIWHKRSIPAYGIHRQSLSVYPFFIVYLIVLIQ